MTLRPGLRLHDGAPVLARGMAASLLRLRDSCGSALSAAAARLSAPGDQIARFRLPRPFLPLFTGVRRV